MVWHAARMYNPKNLSILVESLGFEVIRVESFDFDEQNIIAEALLPLNRCISGLLNVPFRLTRLFADFVHLSKVESSCRKICFRNLVRCDKLLRVKLGKSLNTWMLSRGYLKEAWRTGHGSEIQIHMVKVKEVA